MPNEVPSAEQLIYPELAQIRNALWGVSGRATVMVGAGFSKQAEPLVPKPPAFPLWPDLQGLMERELALSPEPKREVLDVAQEYQRRFGRVALEKLVTDQIPDHAYGPSENHRRLLALEWADVFTTNYDTLLERAANDVFNRRYERIVSPADIAMRTAPRLVKLHGSLPNQRPLVLTRDDYDNYHKSHAPFVNLMHESVMETVFVLVGFSGEDPNFIQWTRWVGEQLGKHAPPVYLCGILDLTPEKRAKIESRNATPLDLGPLFPAEKFPQRDARRAAAMTWFLEVLERGEPAAPQQWAYHYAPKVSEIDPPGPPVKTMTVADDRAVHVNESVDAVRLQKWITVWQAQRLEYPGWIIAANRVRHRVWWATHRVRPHVFQECHQLPPLGQLLLLRELVWRLDLCLLSLWTKEAAQVAALLELINPFPGTIQLPGAATIPPESDWGNIADAWVELALAVLRTAREDFAEALHTLWFDRLQKLKPLRPELNTRLSAEKVYWELARFDLDRLDDAMEQWRHSDQTFWGRAKLAAVYGELGDAGRATELAAAALRDLRKRLHFPQRELDLLSLESWLVHLLEMLRQPTDRRKRVDRDRLNQLRGMGCDPEEICDDLRRALDRKELPIIPAETETIGFDPDSRPGTTRHMGGGQWDEEAVVPAFAVLRLFEVVPHPLGTQNMTWLGEAAARAAVWLKPVALFWSLGFIVRTDRDQFVDEFMDRGTTALLKTEDVERLWLSLSRLARGALKRLSDSRQATQSLRCCRMGDVALELLSRLAFRLNPIQQGELLALLLEWLGSARAASSWIYRESMTALIDRLVYCLSSTQINQAALALLETPILAEKGFGGEEMQMWPEPAEALLDRELFGLEPPVVPEALVLRLCHALAQADKVETNRAAMRLLFLVRRGWLSDAQKIAAEKAFWARLHPGVALPLHVATFGPHALMELPGAADRGVPAIVRASLYGAPLVPLFKEDGKSYEHGVANEFARRMSQIRGFAGIFFPQPPRLPLATGEAEALAAEMQRWWVVNLPHLKKMRQRKSGWPFMGDEEAHKICEGLTSVVGDAILPALPKGSETARSLQLWLDSLVADDFSVDRAGVGRLLAGLAPPAAIENRIDHLLRAETSREISLGAWLLLSWWRGHRAGLIVAAPSSASAALLVQRVIWRPEAGLDRACYWLAALIREYGDDFVVKSRELLLASLQALLQSTDLARWQEDYRQGKVDRARSQRLMELRTTAASLAGAMHAAATKTGRAPEPVLEGWRVLAAQEALPEVRRAWHGEAD